MSDTMYKGITREGLDMYFAVGKGSGSVKFIKQVADGWELKTGAGNSSPIHVDQIFGEIELKYVSWDLCPSKGEGLMSIDEAKATPFTNKDRLRLKHIEEDIKEIKQMLTKILTKLEAKLQDLEYRCS